MTAVFTRFFPVNVVSTRAVVTFTRTPFLDPKLLQWYRWEWVRTLQLLLQKETIIKQTNCNFSSRLITAWGFGHI